MSQNQHIYIYIFLNGHFEYIMLQLNWVSSTDIYIHGWTNSNF